MSRLELVKRLAVAALGIPLALGLIYLGGWALTVFLALIALTPFWIFRAFNIQTFFFGGTGLLIVVGVALDTVQQAQQHLMLRHYDGFMKKGRVKMRGRGRYM